MLWGEDVSFMPRDVPVGALLSCLQIALGRPVTVPRPSEQRPDAPPSGMVSVDLEGWLAFVLLALPMFGAELPDELDAALPYARRMLLTLGMIHSGDTRPETMMAMEDSRRELRRITRLARVDPGFTEIVHPVDRDGTGTVEE